MGPVDQAVLAGADVVRLDLVALQVVQVEEALADRVDLQVVPEDVTTNQANPAPRSLPLT